MSLLAAVETQTNGQEALALLRARQDEAQNQFDLVLSDVYMPDMDGFRLLELIALELDLPVISELAVAALPPLLLPVSAPRHTLFLLPSRLFATLLLFSSFHLLLIPLPLPLAPAPASSSH